MARNVGESVIARLRTVSREKRVDMSSLIVRYALERLLYRISISPYANEFCLKGAILLAAFNEEGDLSRPTADLDLNGFSENGSIHIVEEAIRAAIQMELDEDDGVRFDLDSLKVMKSREGLIPGGKVRLAASVHTARPVLQVDVGFGNVITPDAVIREIPTLLPGVAPRPTIASYPLETVIAEKLHAMVEHGLFNTRHKDYYDVFQILNASSLDGELLVAAVRRTFERQQRDLPADPEGLSLEFASVSEGPWKAFLRKVGATDTLSYPETIEGVRRLLMPVIAAVRNEAEPPGDWLPGVGWEGHTSSLRLGA